MIILPRQARDRHRESTQKRETVFSGGSSIDTDYGCKKLPTGPRPWKGCNNMAWTFTKKGTVISGMEGSDGKDECLQVSSKDESTYSVSHSFVQKTADTSATRVS